jgi:C_GCAxxG_C_C family probable redox protein
VDWDVVPYIGVSMAGGLMVGEVCGAVSAAGLAIGLLYGKEQPEAAAHLTREFMLGFTEQHGPVRCMDITGFDIGRVSSDPDLKSMGELAVYFLRGGKKKCSKVVGGAVRVLLENLNEWEA